MSKLLVDEISDADNTGPVTVTDGLTVQGAFTSLGIDDNATSTAMTLDASGNLIVGGSSSGANNATTLYSNGLIISRSSDTGGVIVADRDVALDGTIIAFRRQNATVGSISSHGNGVDLGIGSGDVGLRFQGSSDAVFPFNTVSNSGRDNAIDLGLSDNRFKDLYLSGGVYLGGTGAANYLDSYEEGVWYPAAASGMTTAAGTPTYSGTYTKVGNIVNVYFRQNGGTLNLSHTGYATGLPFEPSNTLAYVGSATNSGPTIVGICMPWAGGALYFHLDAAYNSQTDFIMSVSYRTA